MQCIVYLSNATTYLPPDELEQLLAVSRRRNAEDGITGILLFNDNIFLQVLEGEADKLAALMERIRRDRRNSSIRILLQHPITERHFPEWSMALATPDQLSEENRRFCRSLSDPLAVMPGGELETHLQRLIETFKRITASFQ